MKNIYCFIWFRPLTDELMAPRLLFIIILFRPLTDELSGQPSIDGAKAPVYIILFRPLTDELSGQPSIDGAKAPVYSAQTNENNTHIYVMNNYFGLGLDADLCLDFHNAR